jgi:hypothetical protein
MDAHFAAAIILVTCLALIVLAYMAGVETGTTWARTHAPAHARTHTPAHARAHAPAHARARAPASAQDSRPTGAPVAAAEQV